MRAFTKITNVLVFCVGCIVLSFRVNIIDNVSIREREKKKGRALCTVFCGVLRCKVGSWRDVRVRSVNHPTVERIVCLRMYIPMADGVVARRTCQLWWQFSHVITGQDVISTSIKTKGVIRKVCVRRFSNRRSELSSMLRRMFICCPYCYHDWWSCIEFYLWWNRRASVLPFVIVRCVQCTKKDKLAPVLPSLGPSQSPPSSADALGSDHGSPREWLNHLRRPLARNRLSIQHGIPKRNISTNAESLSLSLSPPLRRRNMPSYRGACPSL